MLPHRPHQTTLVEDTGSGEGHGGWQTGLWGFLMFKFVINLKQLFKGIY